MRLRKPDSNMNRFIAIDFETADCEPDSACAVAMIVVENGDITKEHYRLIRPPRPEFVFTYLHGIAWQDVAGEPSFAELWPELRPIVESADFFVAHHAPFDRAVLRACCEAAGFKPPSVPFKCTVQIARKTWRLFPTKLPDVCRYLNIDLDHHNALSDARACALIYLAANRQV